MKPNYKNWVPKGMVISVVLGAIISGIALAIVIFSDILTGTAKQYTEIIIGIIFAILFIYAIFCVNWYRTFSYDGKKQFARRIIEDIAKYVDLPEGGVGLDVGCGSGALTIACAKRNPQAKMIGLDRWGKEYASFNQNLCQENALAEGVQDNTSFVQGDACKLPYPDETFDVVTSNYCYHNILTRDRHEIIYESLRVLKKGGTFVIHDLFTRNKYGSTSELIAHLKNMGFEKVELIDTTNGLFMNKKEATGLFLTGSALLIGKK